MKTTTLRPGLLVSLKTSVRGGVSYKRQDIEQEHITEEGSKKARWETEKVVQDPVEFELATKVRSKCRATVTAICAQSDFGLLCPAAREKELAEKIQEARVLADAFNAQAKQTTVSVYVITGRVAYDDVEATRAIGSEIRELLEAMEQGVKNVNPEEIRKAASRAKNLGTMLSESVGEKVAAAVKQAREVAKEIAKKAEESAEAAAAVVQEVQLDSIHRARFEFLDLDEAKPVEALPVTAPAGLDLEPLPTTQKPAEA
jgi:ABC-type oligopeptide transport system ATPase subunit